MQNASIAKRPRNLAQGLVTELTQAILLGKIAPGARLPPETTIVREYGVSRTVVREAISRLQASGLVETRHGVGTFVLEHKDRAELRLSVETAASVREMLELRMGLEVQAVALAAQRRSEAQLAAMRKALEDYDAALAEGSEGMVDADRRFHMLIAEATNNSCFREMMQNLGRAMIPRERLDASLPDQDLRRYGYLANLEHQAILVALTRKDADAARAAMWTHLTNSRLRLIPDS